MSSSRDDPGFSGMFERLEGELSVLWEEGDPQGAGEALTGRHRVEHQRVEAEWLALHRDAVVGDDEATLDAEPVEMGDVVTSRGELIDGRLHRLGEVVELPCLQLADVTVPVDDPPAHLVLRHRLPPTLSGTDVHHSETDTGPRACQECCGGGSLRPRIRLIAASHSSLVWYVAVPGDGSASWTQSPVAGSS